MLALQKVRPGSGIELRDLPEISEIPADEVVIRTEATGICGTDLHIAEWTPGYESMQSAMPVTLGHEFAGTIVSTGISVDSRFVGTRVTVRPSVVCGKCDACRVGDEENCTGRRGIGIGRSGAFAGYVAAPFVNCVVLPDGLDFEIAALTEPMTVCAEAVDTGEVKENDRVLVLGPGFIGQGIALFCDAAGASEVVICGHNDEARLKTLNELGFANTVDTAGTTLSEALHPFLRRGKFDVVIEATGAPQVVPDALACLKKRGILVIAGIHPRPAEIDLTQLVRNHQQVRGSYRAPTDTWHRVLNYLAANQDRVRGLITHRVDLADVEQGFALALGKTASKVVVRHPRA
ncbi:alcohol dehydrogenase catalytic domain-containing protein [Aquamicrobium sp. LC103]|uniref:zinc-dependent alcohol dehydrogenase n=1 Tax=Aquamicrobium sp. LC103 TaxID=1120658 RepID=UPI00063E7B05|nr:alcohol dehydrogenase catalytic domain-containing protein [Aquamicrobium sp. LC103]TKT75873.1 zinc-binding dehydrogenase [Aquamicrobium sp. LC103]